MIEDVSTYEEIAYKLLLAWVVLMSVLIGIVLGGGIWLWRMFRKENPRQ